MGNRGACGRLLFQEVSMANDSKSKPPAGVGGENSKHNEQGRRVADPTRAGRAGGRDDTLDEDLDRERLEPGLNAEGTGGAGANAAKAKGGNSNT